MGKLRRDTDLTAAEEKKLRAGSAEGSTGSTKHRKGHWTMLAKPAPIRNRRASVWSSVSFVLARFDQL